MKYIFYDFNGTILNDVELCLDLLNDILRKQNKKIKSLVEYRNIFTFPIKKYYELAGVDFSINSFEELSKDFIKAYQPKSFECKIYDNLLETVIKLKEAGNMVGILSASQIDNLKEQLNKLGIINEFDFVLGINDIYAHSKLEIAEKFIKENHIDPKDIYFIGDSTHDYEIAQELGANIFLYLNGHQSKEVLEKTHAILINDHADILEYLK